MKENACHYVVVFPRIDVLACIDRDWRGRASGKGGKGKIKGGMDGWARRAN